VSIERTVDTHEPVLVAEALTKRYEDRLVVDSVGFTIGPGETYGVQTG
jgi:ABC-type multidrug transport system ATPase subunit